MGTSHAHASHSRSHGGCGHCDHDHDCDCSKPDRSLIQEFHHLFCAKVFGDYCVEPDDKVVYVFDDDHDDNGNGNAQPAEITLPCPGDVKHDCHHVTIVAAGQNVAVKNAGEEGDRTVNIQRGNAVTFFHVPENDCECGYWAEPLANGTQIRRVR